MAKDTFNLNEWVGNKERRLLKEDYEELTPEEMANQNAGSPMHRPEGLEEESREGKHISELEVGEKFVFDGEEYTFIKLYQDPDDDDDKLKNAAWVELPNGKPSVVSFGDGYVNTGEVSGTGVADMGQGKGHHIDEETYQEKLQRTFKDDPNYHEDIDTEGYVENMRQPDLQNAIDAIKVVWEEWKSGPATEANQLPYALEDLLNHIRQQLSDFDIK